MSYVRWAVGFYKYFFYYGITTSNKDDNDDNANYNNTK